MDLHLLCLRRLLPFATAAGVWIIEQFCFFRCLQPVLALAPHCMPVGHYFGDVLAVHVMPLLCPVL
jgi:hypothetical protein